MQESQNRATWRTVGVTSLGPASWGTTYVVTTEWLPPGRPLLDATVRALPAGLILMAVTRVLPRGIWWVRAGVLGALNIGVFFALLFVAAYRLPGGVAATLGAVQPLVVAGLSVVLLRQRVTALTVVAGLTGVAGVALLVLRGTARLDGLGVLAGLLATGSMALGIVLAKRWGRPEGVGAVPFTGWLLTAGGLLLLPLALVAEGPPPALTGTHVGGFVYLATVNTAFAYVVWLRGIERLPATSVAFLGLMSPLVATVTGWLLLGEHLTAVQGLGMVLALGALAAAQLPAAGPVTAALRRRAAGLRADAPLCLAPATPRFGGWIRQLP